MPQDQIHRLRHFNGIGKPRPLLSCAQRLVSFFRTEYIFLAQIVVDRYLPVRPVYEAHVFALIDRDVHSFIDHFSEGRCGQKAKQKGKGQQQ